LGPGARHLSGTGLSQTAVERAIESDAQAGTASFFLSRIGLAVEAKPHLSHAFLLGLETQFKISLGRHDGCNTV